MSDRVSFFFKQVSIGFGGLLKEREDTKLGRAHVGVGFGWWKGRDWGRICMCRKLSKDKFLKI